MNKELFASTVYKISDKLNISQVLVRDTINALIDEVRDTVLGGKSVWVLGLVSITVSDASFRNTLALTSKNVAYKTGVPYQTCLQICNLYLDSLRNNLCKGKDVSIRGICTLHVVTKLDGNTHIMSSISRALVDSMDMVNPQRTVRVRTCRYLKEMME